MADNTRDSFEVPFTLYLRGVCNLGAQTHIAHFCAVFSCIMQPTGSRFVRPIVPNKCVKFRDPHLNRSREVSPEPIWGSILYTVFSDEEVVSDVISNVAVACVASDVRTKFGDSRSTRFWDIKPLILWWTNDDVADGRRSSHKADTVANTNNAIRVNSKPTLDVY